MAKSRETANSELLERIQKLSPKRLALLAGELERRLASQSAVHSAPTPEPVAVIGMACRLPGGANSPDAFWDLLVESRDAIEEVPSTRWDAAAFYDPNPGVPGKANTKWGGFVDGIDQFDAAFFGIAPREAVAMDPQQRLLLEVAWEALEQAGEATESLNGSLTGVFVGISTNDYATLREHQPGGLFDAYSGSGVARSVAAGRLSYFLGLKGPNIALDTACSSSAVAIHLACQSLRQEECRMALAGGVNALLTPQVTIALAQARMLAGDGRCKTFAESADGFVRSEGCGILVLKRLSDAVSNGDRIVGLIRGSAINHDGRSSGLTAPNGPSQETVIRAALRQAGAAPAAIDYIEAHGTGTVLGDAIELGALGATFASRPPGEPVLKLGSVKTNVGHLEAAAGVTSVMKVLLSLEHEQLPAHLHLSHETRNPALAELPFDIGTTLSTWPIRSRPRVAGVSSFGFSGTNAHIVVQEAPPASNLSGVPFEAEIVTLSAKTPEALERICALHHAYLTAHPETCLADLAFTLNSGRSHFQHRLALLVRSTEELGASLAEIVKNGIANSPAYRFISSFDQPPVAFIFSGQGSQFAAMGADLYRHSSVFRACLDHCDDLVAGTLPHRLSDVMRGVADVPEDLIHETAWTQPVLLAFEYSLAMLWRSWGVTPTSVLGHSIGEIAAACIAEVFSIDAALKLACERGRLMATMPGGKMLAMRLTEAEALELIRPFDGLSLAAVNGIRSVVISGEPEQIESLRATLSERGVASQPLAVGHAFHSAMMEPILDEFETYVSSLTLSEPVLPIVSNVTGSFSVTGKLTRPVYWRDHLRGTVRFADGVIALAADRPAVLLEIGPDATLTKLSKPLLSGQPIQTVASQARGREASTSLYEALIALYLAGKTIDWKAVYVDRPARKLALPTYPFQRQRYWIETAPEPPAEVQEEPEVAPVSVPLTGLVSSPQLYATEWQPHTLPDALAPAQTPAHIVDSANRYLTALGQDEARRQEIESYQQFMLRLNRLCSLYILKALRELAPNLWDGARLRHETLARDLGAGAQHQRLLERLLYILEEDDLARLGPAGWTIRAPIAQDAEGERRRMAADFPQFSAEVDFLRGASQLGAVLRRQMPPLQALFPDGSMQLAERVYQEAPAARMFNAALAEAVRKLIANHSATEMLSIIEVGAGTGSTTASILPLLHPSHTRYLFTDLSPAFLHNARDKFSAYPFVEYATLDIESSVDAAAQPADIIIASNVLHATADLAQTLRNVKRLLKPGGSVVILEGTAPQRFGDLTVGMTDGWWRYTDLHRRPDYPLISRRQWLELLAEEGFECAALDHSGWSEMLTSRQTILVASLARSVFAETKTEPEILLVELAGTTLLSSHLTSIGTEFERIEVSQSASAPPDPELAAAVRGWLGDHRERSTVVLHIPASVGSDAVPVTVEENAAAMLSVLQAVVGSDSLEADLVFATHGSADIAEDHKRDLAGCAADALLKTARLEYPQLRSRWIDLPIEPLTADLSIFTATLSESAQENALAIRSGRIFVPRMHTVRHAATTPIALRKDAAYLVTGAYSGLGFNAVEWLAARGAGCIALMGRSKPSPEIFAKMQLLEQSGVQLVACTGDVALDEDLEFVFDRVADSGLPLCGIVHSAGATEDATLLQQDRAMLQHVFAAKVHGAWNLHRLALSHPLDFFVLFGSAASTLGAAGQANHAAANGFLNALSFYRASLGLASLTIAWGPWSEIGAATRVKDTGRGVRAGFTPISPVQGNCLIEDALGSGVPSVSALNIDWATYRHFHPAPSTLDFLEGLSADVFKHDLSVQEDAVAGQSAFSDILPRLLEATDPIARRSLIDEYLLSRILAALGLASADVLLPEQPFSQLGLDSLMALELKNQIQRDLNLSLSSNFFFEYPNLQLASEAVESLLADHLSSTVALPVEFEEFVL